MLQTSTSRANGHVDVITLAQAWSMHQSGRIAEAEAAYRDLLRGQPDQPDALNCLGILLLQDGRGEDALELFRQAVAIHPANAALQINLARAALKSGDSEGVLRATEAAIACGGGESAWLLRGVGLRELDRDQASLIVFRQALSLFPDSFPVRYNLAACELAAGNAQIAEHQYQELVETRPNDARGWLGLGNAQSSGGRFPEALEAYAQARQLDPDLADLHTQCGLLAIQMGRPDEAIALLRRALELQPRDQNAVAALAIAATQADDKLAACLLDFERIIARSHIQSSPPRHDPVDTAQLIAEVLAHPSLQEKRSGKTTRIGAQTASLVDATTPALAAFNAELRQRLPALIDAQARSYVAIRHPLAGTQPAQWRLNLWATVLHAGGHQDPHLHPSGWLSGVYYLAVPGIIADSDSGWIEFGAPPVELVGDRAASLPWHRIRPRAGELLTFPAYLYHRTLPHADPRPRISLAFDVVPV